MPRTISLYEVLAIDLQDQQLRIIHIRRKNGHVPIEKIVIDCHADRQCNEFVHSVRTAAYRGVPIRKRVKVLLNPFGGSGKATSIWKTVVSPILEAAQYTVSLEVTTHQGHATEIAGKLPLEDFDVVLCISGDGLPHEVINGLGRRNDANRALTMPIGFVPAGSGNGSAKSIYDTQKPIDCVLGFIKGVETPVDLIYMTQGDDHFLSYFSLSFGVIAECDLGTEHLRWMGEARFTFGVVQRILSRTAYPCTLSLSVVTDKKNEIKQAYHDRQSNTVAPEDQSTSQFGKVPTGLSNIKYGTVKDDIPKDWVTRRFPKMGTFYVGLMPYMSSTTCFFPTAVPASGHMDALYIQADVPFLSAMNTIAAVDSAKHFASDYCYYAKCDAFRLVPHDKAGYISVDGEKVPFGPIQGEILRATGKIITKNGQYFSQFQE